MEAAVIDKIVALAAPTLSVIDNLQYSSKQIYLVKPPVIGDVDVFTLDGLLDLVRSGFEKVIPETHLIHIVSQSEVKVLPRVSDEYGQRPTAIHTKMLDGDRQFNLNNWINQEEAVIGLRSCFVAGDGDIDYVIKTASTLTSEDKLLVEDNGQAQTVTVKSGVSGAMTVNAELKARVSLAPFRTFREVEQPKSDFVLRIRKGPLGQPQIGLFEADGGAWKMDAIHNVRDWLKAQLDAWTIVA